MESNKKTRRNPVEDGKEQISYKSVLMNNSLDTIPVTSQEAESFMETELLLFFMSHTFDPLTGEIHTVH